MSHFGSLRRTGMPACAGPSRPHTCVSGSPGRGGWGGQRSPLWAAATGPGLFRSLGFNNPSGYWLFGGQHTATQGRGVGSAWAPACAVCVCAGAYRVAWRSRWGVGVSVVWSVALYPPCAGDACRIPAAAVALWSPATKAWRGQPL